MRFAGRDDLAAEPRSKPERLADPGPSTRRFPEDPSASDPANAAGFRPLAGGGKGSVYLAFDSKADLFYGLVEQLTDDVLGDELDPAMESSRHVRDRIDDAFYRIAETIDQNESLIPLA